MKRTFRWLPLVAVGLLCGCGQMPATSNAQWEAQTAEYDRQMKAGAEQLKRSEEMYDRGEELQRKQEKLAERNEALMTKWEQQSERFDRVLDQWEKIGASSTAK